MNSNNKGMCIAAAAILAAFGVSHAQSNQTLPEDYTSAMTTTVSEGYSVAQHVGGAFGIPVLESGEDILLQGLYAILNGISEGPTTGIGSIVAEDGSIGMEFDSVLKTLTVESTGKGRIYVVNSNGQTVINIASESGMTKADLSELTPGLYIAGYTSNNKINKTLKFIVK